MDYFEPLQPNQFYHIYNRGNNKETIFYTNGNYHFFLRQYDRYLSDYVETYAYCLLPNHFHLLVRVKDVDSINRLSKFSKLGKSITDPSGMISEAFRRFFMSYSKAINKQQLRTGSLFQKNFKRKQITNDAYLTASILYIHANPQKHGICADFRQYEHSSFGRMLIERPTKLMKAEVLDWFGGVQGYIKSHDNLPMEVLSGVEMSIED